MSWIRRFLNIARPDSVSRDLDREFAHHLAETRDALVRDGMTPAEATAEARRLFGNATAQKEQARDFNILTWLDSCLADVRLALRALRRSPAFAIVAVLSLAVGIGANTAIFSLINAVMLKSLPVSHPEQLVAVTAANAGPNDHYFTHPLWKEIRDHQDMFAGVLATANTRFDLTSGGEVRRATGEYVSGDYFNVLGVRSAAGRLFSRADDVRDCPRIAVLSGAFWASEFGGQNSAIGKSIELNGKRFEIVGVADPSYFGFTVGSTTQVFVPFCAQAVISGSNANLDERDNWWITITARLKPEMSEAQLHSRLIALSKPVFEATLPPHRNAKQADAYLKSTLTTEEPRGGGLSGLRDRYKTALFTLMVVVAVVLLIACANVANLLLARARARQREAAVRLAVGAGRGRLVRQLLTESLVLSMLGTTAGVFLAIWGTRVLVALLAGSRNTVWLDTSFDGRVLAFTSIVAILTGVLFGVAPAWRSANVDPQGAMRGSGRGITGGRGHFPLANALVVGQVALSLVLLVAAGLLLGSFERQVSIDVGFRRNGVLVVNTDVRRTGVAGSARAGMYQTLLERLRQLPGVQSAANAGRVPFGNMAGNVRLHVDGFAPENEDDDVVWSSAISARYFETLGTPILAGRDFGSSETPTSPKVAIVNESVAKKFFGGASPIGRFVALDDEGRPGDRYQIVGVVKDSKYSSLRETSSATIFFPSNQEADAGSSTVFAVRTSGPPATVIPAVKSTMHAASNLIAFDFATLETLLDNSLAQSHLLARLAIFFGLLALSLAIIGLYGTMSYSVEQRRNEIGIRLALGAARSRVLSLVLAEAGRMVLAGIVVGIALSLAATRWVSALLYGVTPMDARTFTLAALTLAAVALAASAIPAWRAARLDPVEALREE